MAIIQQHLLHPIGKSFVLTFANTTNGKRFRRENFRIISGSYDTQTSLTGSSNVWDSTKHITASNGGHTNGLQFYNDLLVSPTNSLNSGTKCQVQ